MSFLLPPQRKTYDVCIVGSGAGGGMAAYALTRAGANVLLLEAGGPWDNTRDSAMLKWASDSPRRGASTRDRPFGEFDACLGGWELEGEPFTQAEGTEFRWWRARMVGGRTNHWGRISLRFGPEDFKAKTRDGLGDDWPIGYNNVAPYYDRIDKLIGVFGNNDNLPNHPGGYFLPPPKPRCYELMIKDAADRLNITCVAARLSIITRNHNGRAACHYCGQCNRGCMTNSNFSSTNVLIAPALKTGRLTLVTHAMAREVTLNANGLASGVTYIDTKTGGENHANARVVVLAASACETARLLLNSKSSKFPDGLANSSGVVGKYLTDTTGSGVSGYIPKMVDHVPHNEDGVGGMHVYMPWWGDNKKLGFPRGYHVEVGGGLYPPSYGFMGGIQHYPSGGGYGKALKEDYRRYYGASVYFSGRGEMIPNDQSYCELDPTMKDKYGIPVLRFHWQWSEYEYNQVRHMQETFRALIADMGGQVFDAMPDHSKGYGIAKGGEIIHELGTVRMGSDPSKSAVDSNCRAHDVKNLFVTDGGPFVSQADKNPTWTILALSMRTSDYITQEKEEGGTLMSSENEKPSEVLTELDSADAKPTKEMSRREAVQLMSVLPIAAALGITRTDQEKAWRFVDEARRLATEGIPFAPKFFTAAEYRSVGILADMIIPRDERSGSATDSGVPEFMDFIMMDFPNNQKWMRPGLAWLDAQSTTRFGKPFSDVAVAQREQILNDIAWPARAPATMADGVNFFNRFRDLTSSGFWSSRMGVKDLRYIGNTFNPNWDGCPPEALAKLGVTYAKFDPKKLRLTP